MARINIILFWIISLLNSYCASTLMCGNTPITDVDTSFAKGTHMCVSSNLHLACITPMRIQIDSVCYGEQSRHRSSCRPREDDCIIDVASYHQSVHDKLHRRCNNNTSCDYRVKNVYVTTPDCEGHIDYIFVSYLCVDMNQYRSTDHSTEVSTKGQIVDDEKVAGSPSVSPDDISGELPDNNDNNGKSDNSVLIAVVSTAVVCAVLFVSAALSYIFIRKRRHLHTLASALQSENTTATYIARNRTAPSIVSEINHYDTINDAIEENATYDDIESTRMSDVSPPYSKLGLKDHDYLDLYAEPL